jgi:phenylacetate-CoA ligase
MMTRLYWTAFTAWHLLGQARYPYRSPERIARDRDRNVRRMVRYAYRWVPYYHETIDRLGLSPRDFHTFDDLRKLPLISVADLQPWPDAFRSTQHRDDDLLPLASSGSTGSPHTIWHSPSSLYLNAAHGERHHALLQRLLGKRRGYRTVTIDALPGQTEEVQAAMRANAIWPRGMVRPRILVDDDQPLDELAATIARLRPDVLGGFGATIGELVLKLDAQGELPYLPRVIRYSVEALPEAARRLLGKYGVEILSVYQSCEAFKLGWECEAHQGYHINADYYPTRIVGLDGQEAAPGDVGEIVICNLTNRGTVLLNYRTGDLAARLDEPCPCGRNLPRIGWVQGRIADALLAPDGSRVPWWLLGRALTDLPGVWQFQVVQESRQHITVRVLAGPDCDQAAVAQTVRAIVAQRMGATVAVEVAFVDGLEHTAAGKLRHVINRIEAPA